MPLRTAAQCLAKAAEMDRLAAQPGAPEAIADLRFMARCWRAVAFQARWQDAHARQG
jgi:hypothetical protein